MTKDIFLGPPPGKPGDSIWGPLKMNKMEALIAIFTLGRLFPLTRLHASSICFGAISQSC